MLCACVIADEVRSLGLEVRAGLHTGSVPFFAPSRANDPAYRRWWGQFERLGASPAAATALMRMNSKIDIRGILPTIRVPTLVIHRTGDATIDVEGGRYLAEHISGARYLEFAGNDHMPFVGDNVTEIADAIQEFLTGSRAVVPVDRVLATVLFTDIVGSAKPATIPIRRRPGATASPWVVVDDLDCDAKFDPRPNESQQFKLPKSLELEG